MAISNNDKSIIRNLAKQYYELATDEKQQKMNGRMKATNDLKIVRPPVLMDEIPWYQMNIDGALDCVCEEPDLRKLEFNFRSFLYRRKYFKCDTLFEPFFRVTMAYDSTGIGVTRKESVAQVQRTDSQNNIISREFIDIFDDEGALERIKIPMFTPRPDKDARAMEYYTELFGDSLPVKLCGRKHFSFHPWDDIVYLRGVEPVMYDLYDRPEFMHALIKKFCAAAVAEIDFIEKNMRVDPTSPTLHCTPAMISGLADDGLRATWFRGTAQAFGSISPNMTKEYEIDYIKPLAERFAYTYYGCCEPLDNKIDIIKDIKNLRKIGVSPWASVERSAEQIEGNYVFARKPNPANVAISTDPDVIRRETEQTVKACIKYGCPCEFVLKDISTVSHKPENLMIWANTVSDVLDEYYEKA